MSLRDKVVLIVGGGRGIGASTARAAGAQGATVVVSYLRDDAAAESLVTEVRAKGGRIEAFRSDAHDGQQVRALVEEVHASNGRLDAVVHCAPGKGSIRPLHSTTWEEFILPTESKLRGAFELARAAVPLMQRQHSGRFVFVSSSWAKNPTLPGLCGMSAAYGAEVSFARALAREVGADGITVNAVAPGMVDTELSAGIPEEVRRQVAAATPLGRIATPGDIADVVVFLCSNDSRFMTGLYVPVNGGATTE